MGLADRDYYRNDMGTGGRGGSGVGRLALVSFNTWLIVANVAIFILMVAMSQFPRMQQPLFFQPEWDPKSTPEQRSRAQRYEDRLDRRLAFQPIELYDPQTMAVYPDGSPIIAQGGRPMAAVIGRQRVAMVTWIDYWGHFSTERVIFGWEVWRFLTFQFLHATPMHLLFNMMGLWFVGGLVEQYLGSKRYFAFYLTCGIFGGVAYLLLNFLGAFVFPHSRFPGLLIEDISTPLVGASAGIFGVLMAAAFIAPTAIVQVMGVIPMKMRTAVYAFTGIAAVNLFMRSSNAGGEAAHMGGAIAGYFFIRRPYLLRDFFDILGRDDPGSRAGRGQRGPGDGGGVGAGVQAEVDRILTKVRETGLHSLTDGEKRTLRDATAAQRGGPSGRGL